MGQYPSVHRTAKMSQAQQLAMRVPKQESFGTFLYNKSEGTVLGRTGNSWGKIGAFYLVFYSFLAAWFAVIMTIFYHTLSYEVPTYTPGQDGGSILKNVALGYRPLSPVVESTLIWIDRSNNETMKHWINNLNQIVEPYRNKTKGVKYVNCDDSTQLKKDEVCDFPLMKFSDACKVDNWGFKAGKPCILLKLNKMINWEPQVYETLEELDKDMPAHLKAQITEMTTANGGVVPKKIWLSCQGKYKPDEDTTGPITLHPYPGFDAFFYPYTNTKGYLAPLVALELSNPAMNLVINIECKAWAKNIKQERAFRFGLIDFEVIID